MDWPWCVRERAKSRMAPEVLAEKPGDGEAWVSSRFVEEEALFLAMINLRGLINIQVKKLELTIGYRNLKLKVEVGARQLDIHS